MKKKAIYILHNWPMFLVLLPFFFMFHILNENFAPGLPAIAIKLSFIYLGIGLLLSLIFFLFFRSIKKAFFFAFMLLAYNFFFGALHDGLRSIAGKDNFIVRYLVVTSVSVVLYFFLFFYLRKTVSKLTKAFSFLNILITVLMIMELAKVVPALIKENRTDRSQLSTSFLSCDTCRRPDVYLIITDEYAGKQQLKEVFSFDNTSFENELKVRGFHVVNSPRSNYNATAYSMASLLNMDYLSFYKPGILSMRDIELGKAVIRENNIVSFFTRQAYEFKNNSFFYFAAKKNKVSSLFYEPSVNIFTNQLFTSRFKKEIGHNFLSKKRVKKIKSNFKLRQYYNDETVDSLTRQYVLQKGSSPKFVYSHYVRPHAPFLYNKEGELLPEQGDRNELEWKKMVYPEYVLYTNKKLLETIDFILQKSSAPPVILLASDHGLRFLDDKLNNKYSCMNQCAVFLPSGNYRQFYSGMSLVNLFRVVLNTEFGQKLPLLKDSSIIIKQLQE